MLKSFILLLFVAYVQPLNDNHHPSVLPQPQSSIFTSQVINYQNGNTPRQQFQNGDDMFHLLLVEQTSEGSLRAKPSQNDEFQAQGTKKEKKVSTPKWRLGAGAFLNKEIDEGSTEKETTFIPTKIGAKLTDSDSDSESDSDCDSSSESDRKKKKKTFKLFSLDNVNAVDEEDQEAVATDEKNQKMVVENTVNLENTTFEKLMRSFYILLLMALAMFINGKPVLTYSSATNLIQTNMSGENDLTYQIYNITTLENILMHTNTSNPEVKALIKKKKKLIPKWQYNAGIYVEKKVNKKLLKKAGKGGFALMSSDGGDSTYAIIGDNEIDNENVFHIPSSFVVARASPNTHSLFAENATEYVSIQYEMDTNSSQFQGTSDGQSSISYDEDYEESCSNRFAYNPQMCIWAVLSVAFCLL
ncbi:hypothetical protein CANMA_004742 [Candida margitis]|uniref:uncharacterized protein n=1 Tax=Candida margitis TaxID=1775924 RepID=UPI0022270DA2|nr:uncharacterized protein CANMA_004742 [Candida margitis]KAI5953903.1 hypothetical protein CANMA_004742 [Candida margitis]